MKIVILAVLFSLSVFAQTSDITRRQAEKLIEEAELSGGVLAIQKREEAVRLYREIKDQVQTAITLLSLSSPYLVQGNRAKAEAVVREAEALAGEELVVKPRILMAKGWLAGASAKYQEAVAHYEEATVLAVNDPSLQAEILNNMAIQFSSLGERQKANFYYEQVFRYFDGVGDVPNAISSLSNLAMSATSGADYQLGLSYITRAFLMAKTPSQIARCHTIRGGIYSLLGNELARSDFEAASAIYEKDANEFRVAETHYLLADYWIGKEDYAKALAASLKAETGFRGKFLLSEAGVTHQLGFIYMFLEPVKSQAYFEQIVAKKYPPIYQARALIGMGRLARERGDLRTSTEKLTAALALFGTNASPHKADCLYHLARTRWLAKDVEQANAYIDRAVEVLENQTLKLDSLRYRSLARSKFDDVYGLSFEIKRTIDPRLAFAQHEQYLARTLRDFAGKLQPVDDAQKARFAAKMSELVKSPKDVKVRGEADVLAAELDKRKTSVGTIPLAQIQAALSPDTLVLEFVSRSNIVFAITSDSFYPHSLPHEANALAGKLLQTITAQASPPLMKTIQQVSAWESRMRREQQTAIVAASRALLGQLELNGKRKLVVVADGVLAQLPFGVLEVKGRALIETHELLTVPTASLIPKTTILPLHQIAVVAGAEQESASAPLRDTRLSRLANAPIEISAIRKSHPQTKVFSSSERGILGTVQSYNVLHFVAHSTANFSDPEMSVIHLNPQNRETGDLFAIEISKQSLGASLVVLSSCESNVGLEIKGEGVNSLAYSFMLAGAKQVVSSQWRVDDRFTSLFMAKFYAALQVKPDAAYALQQAQQQMKATQRWQSPFYWAAFTLQGVR